MQSTNKLKFILDVEEDWPPVAIEALPCTAQRGGFRIETAPLFVKGISNGDVVSVEFDANENVCRWEHLEKSARTTIWLLRIADSPDIDSILEQARSLKCNTTGLKQFGCYAIDVPAECDFADVDALFEGLDSEHVAVAYPSFRHEDGRVEN